MTKFDTSKKNKKYHLPYGAPNPFLIAVFKDSSKKQYGAFVKKSPCLLTLKKILLIMKTSQIRIIKKYNYFPIVKMEGRIMLDFNLVLLPSASKAPGFHPGRCIY